MWIKYKITADNTYPIGLKFNAMTNEVILGGPIRVTDLMYTILTNYFELDDINPIKSSHGKIKFNFDMNVSLIYGILSQLKDEGILVENVDSLGRIYR